MLIAGWRRKGRSLDGEKDKGGGMLEKNSKGREGGIGSDREV